MRRIILLLVIIVGISSCSFHNNQQNKKKWVKSHQNNSHLCRAIVNTSDGYVSLVTIHPDGFVEEKHWSNVMIINDVVSQVMRVPYIAHDKYYLEQMWIKNITNKIYSYINTIEDATWDNDFEQLCMSLDYHLEMNLKYIKNPYIRLGYDIILSSPLSKESFLQKNIDEIQKNRRLCYCNDLWCRYEENDRRFKSCELLSLDRHVDNIELIGHSILGMWYLEKETCSNKGNERLYFKDDLRWENNRKIYTFFGDPFISDKQEGKIREALGLMQNYCPFRPVLFTQGNGRRRWFGNLIREDTGDYKRVELPFMTEGLNKILDEIEHAPDGCARFDWDTVELVSGDGRRYQIANGDYESIAGIYWLKPNDVFSLDMLDDKPDKPIVLDEGYEPPKPQPNCRYFSDEAKRERWEEKRRICYECESKYDNPEGTGITPDDTCREYDRDYDDVKDEIDI